MATAARFLVNTSDLTQTRLQEDAAPPAIADGQILLKVDRFAFTANNITYAASWAELGDRFSYWDFFPSGESGWGVIPVWGFADVVASRHEVIRVGERIYGFWPMATHTVLTPQRVSDGGFLEASPHRLVLPPTYNVYMRCAGDPIHRADLEDLQALLRPLYATAWMLDDFLADQNFFGAERVLLSSASSKTAASLAHYLSKRPGIEIVGLTSAGNHAYVERLGVYHHVLAYEELMTLDADRRTTFVDFAGNAALHRSVHSHFGNALAYSSKVGYAHHAAEAGEELPGPQPVFFFVPDHLRKRAQDWGRNALNERLAQAWLDFAPRATNWLRITRTGRAGVPGVHADTLAGRVPADCGHILSLWN